MEGGRRRVSERGRVRMGRGELGEGGARRTEGKGKGVDVLVVVVVVEEGVREMKVDGKLFWKGEAKEGVVGVVAPEDRVEMLEEGCN